MPRERGGPLVKLEEVAKVYKNRAADTFALDRVSLEIEQGEFVVVLGPSGSGKSTLLNLVGGIDTASSGLITVKNVDLNRLTEQKLVSFRRKYLGYVFQYFNLLPSLTARENVDLVANLVGRRKRTPGLMKELGLDGLEDRFPSQLSGGEQQRVAIARALVKDPVLLLCDEPTGSLDFENGRAVLELLKAINSRRGTTTVVVTHNTVIGKIADRVIHLGSGKIIEDKRIVDPCLPRELRW
ncbi:MAG TPA: ABC transporter ATP-binding protein [Desulfobacteria bacterium]|nr:ABC transporter ATP-binding protein [Desulfobacteria bacterium]